MPDTDNPFSIYHLSGAAALERRESRARVAWDLYTTYPHPTITEVGTVLGIGITSARDAIKFGAELAGVPYRAYTKRPRRA